MTVVFILCQTSYSKKVWDGKGESVNVKGMVEVAAGVSLSESCVTERMILLII